MFTGSLIMCPVAYDAFRTGISGRTFAMPIASTPPVALISRGRLEVLHDLGCGPLRRFALAIDQRNDRSALPDRDDRLRTHSSLDVIADAVRHLARHLAPELELVAVEVDDVEDQDVLLSLLGCAVRDMLLGRCAHLPDVLRAPAHHVVVTEAARG